MSSRKSRKRKRDGEEWPCNPLLIDKGISKLLAFFMETNEEAFEKLNRHHPFPTSITRNIENVIRLGIKAKDKNSRFMLKNIHRVFDKFGYNFTDNSLKLKLGNLMDNLLCENYYVVPEIIHRLYNSVFFRNSQIGSLLKLDWIFHEDRKFNGDYKKNLMDFLFFVSLVYKKNSFTLGEVDRLKTIKNSEEEFLTLSLLDFMKINVGDVLKFIDEYFFHPYWHKPSCSRHFILLFFCRYEVDINSKEMELCFRYYRQNGIDKIVPRSNDDGTINEKGELIRTVLNILCECQEIH